MNEFLRVVVLALICVVFLGLLYMLGVFFSSGEWNPLQWCLFGKILTVIGFCAVMGFFIDELDEL